MQEKTLQKVAIIVALLGLIFLSFYAENLQFREVARIDSEVPEEKVRMQGKVTRVSPQDKVIFLELDGEIIEKVKVILFTDESVYLKQGDRVEISGTVEEYQGEKEVIANEVVLLG